MLKYLPALGALALLPVPASSAPLGPDAARCRPGAPGSALIVAVSGFKARVGRVRVQLYGARPADFLARGKKLHRVDIPVSGNRMDICVPLPRPGRYAIAVRHDADRDGDSGWNDGGGFSRNPSVSLANLRPKHSQVAFTVGPGIHHVPVVLLYRRGLSIRPASKARP